MPAVVISGGTVTDNSFEVTMKDSIGLAVFSQLYTTGQLTLCQAVTGLQAQVMNQNLGPAPNKDTLMFLGHRFCDEDQIAIDEGFEGDFRAWWDAGNRPRGYYQLFQDNYEQYKETTCTPTTQAQDPATAESRLHCAPTVDQKRTTP